MADIHPLTDEQMHAYIVNGYLVVKTELAPKFHNQLYEQTENIFEKEGNPGNNLLPRLPAIQQVFNDPNVTGALTGLLGPGYYMHPHRHCHRNPPGSPGQKMHKDAWSRRHHHTRWAMAFYYPQDTPQTLGPSSVVPGSHFFNTYSGNNNDEQTLCGEAGDVIFVHYDLWHRATPNTGDRVRYMMKFLFVRMEDPHSPSWNTASTQWRPVQDHPETKSHNLMWKHLWDWHCGKAPESAGTGAESLTTLIETLAHSTESLALNAAYHLAEIGAPAIPALLESLEDASEEARRNIAYALSAMGVSAVPALIKIAQNSNHRAFAIEVLADLGALAVDAAPTLVEALKDPYADVRRWAAEALGNMAATEPAVVSALSEALRDPDEDVRRTAALALAKLGPKAESALPALIETLADNNRYTQSNAIEALKRIGTPEAVNALLSTLATARWCPITTPESTF